MDSPVQPPTSASQAKGFATIALASAAGVIVASRMNRPALMLAAGLALSWWRRQANPTVETPTFESLATDAIHEPSLVMADTVNPPQPPLVEPTVDAWDDLRAAISPELGKTGTPMEPLHRLPGFSVSPPSSPMIAVGELEAMVPAQSIHFAPLSDEFSPSISDSISLPVIAEIESRLESDSGDFMLMGNEAPVVMPERMTAVSQEAQTRKTFFDWLRN